MARLKRADCNSPGITRRRAGKGFLYLDENGERIADRDVVERIKGLVIPPAWDEVWICPKENGHIQATGFDDAGRKQYLYHAKWSESRSSRKFREMLDFANRLPGLRRAVDADLDPSDPGRPSVLACGVRLMDLGHFRIGSERYAAENETYGVATILRKHVSPGERSDEVLFDYVAKGSLERSISIRDEKIREISELLLRRRSGPDDFLAYKEGRRWLDVTTDDLNGYIKSHAGEQFSAKDFRTWNGTVLAAVALADGEMPASARGRDRRIKQAVDRVAEELGNTPAVARSSYIDPRLLDLFRNGHTISATSRGRVATKGLSAVEKQVLELLKD